MSIKINRVTIPTGSGIIKVGEYIPPVGIANITYSP